MATSNSTLALDALNTAQESLRESSVEFPRRNAEILLSEVLGVKAYEIYLERELALDTSTLRTYMDMIKRRGAGVPLEYILGNVDFMGLRLSVLDGVFIPRPETEVLCEIVLQMLKDTDSPLVADVCTGCGAIALALASLRADLRCFGTDISGVAVTCAEKNADHLRLGDRVRFLEGNLLDALESRDLGGKLDCVVANPPYVKDGDVDRLPVHIRDHEPTAALRGGAKGTDFYPDIVQSAKDFLKPGGFIALEVGDGSADDVSSLLKCEGFSSVESRSDLRRIPRFVVGVR